MVNGHDIPVLSYFENKNVFSGSEGKNFRFRLEIRDDKLHAFVWHEDLCFEACKADDEKTFPVSSDGLSQAVDWIYKQKLN